MSDPNHRFDQTDSDQPQSHTDGLAPGSEQPPQHDQQPPPQESFQQPQPGACWAPGWQQQTTPQAGAQQAPPPGWQQQTTPQGGYQQAPPQGGYQPSQQGSHYQQPGFPPASKVGRPAELLDRFVARLLDGIILAVVGGLVVGTVIIGAIFQGSVGALGFGGSSWLASAVSAVLTAALYLAYFGFLESSRGQTLGKMVMKLETQGPDGGRPTLEQALRRNAFMALGVLGVIPIIGGLLGGLASLAAAIIIAVGINNDVAGRRGWHDQFAGGTQVIKTG